MFFNNWLINVGGSKTNSSYIDKLYDDYFGCCGVFYFKLVLHLIDLSKAFPSLLWFLVEIILERVGVVVNWDLLDER